MYSTFAPEKDTDNSFDIKKLRSCNRRLAFKYAQEKEITLAAITSLFDEAGLTYGDETDVPFLAHGYAEWAATALSPAVGEAGAAFLRAFLSQVDRLARGEGRVEEQAAPAFQKDDPSDQQKREPVKSSPPVIEYVDPGTLIIDERLKSLVPRPRAATRAAMLASIQQDGVREAIHARRCDRKVFDGFTRHELTLDAGTKQIPVIFHDIPPDGDLAERTIRAAVERRQLTQWELIRMAANYMEIEAARSRERMLSARSADPRIDRSEDRISGRTREIVAKSLTISSGTMLDRGLYILRNAPQDTLKKLDDDDPSVSITGIYEELRKQVKSSPTDNEKKTATTTPKTIPDAKKHDHEEPVDAPAPRQSSERATTAPTGLVEGGGVTSNSEPESAPQKAQDDQVIQKFMRTLRDMNGGLQPFVEVVARDTMFIADARSATSTAFEIARVLEAAFEAADAMLQKEIEDGLEEGPEPTEEPAGPAAQEEQAGAIRQDGAAEPPIVVLSEEELGRMNNL